MNERLIMLLNSDLRDAQQGSLRLLPLTVNPNRSGMPAATKGGLVGVLTPTTVGFLN